MASPGRLPKSRDRKSTRLNSSHQIISYAVFCLNKKNLRGRLFGTSFNICLYRIEPKYSPDSKALRTWDWIVLAFNSDKLKANCGKSKSAQRLGIAFFMSCFRKKCWYYCTPIKNSLKKHRLKN